MEFQLENGEKIDVAKHTQSIIDLYPDTKVYVGCDSQNKKKGCVYAVVIAYRFTYGDGTRKGARYIYTKEWVDKMKDKFTRLFGEVTRSVEVAQWLEREGFKVHKIDLDFNLDITAGSHNMVAVGSGYVKGFGFDPTCKPEEQIASRAADHIVKHKRNKRKHHRQRKKERV